MYQKIQIDFKKSEPYISEDTMKLQYEIYLNYLNTLNKLLLENNYDYKYSKEELVNYIDIFPINVRDDILVNLGGVLNHELYFSILNKKTNNNFEQIIIKEFGSMNNFKQQFINTANNMFGSGYTYLVINKEKKLEILNFSNEDTPYIYGLIPIMALDLWEHSYYLDYKIDRKKYIENFFELIDFDIVNNNYEKNIKLL